MELKYVPDTASVGLVDFRPFMVEVAWNYCQLAIDAQRGMIGQTLAALAIEIVLKSYTAVVVENAGELNEAYQFQPPAGSPKPLNRHNLIALAALLRPDVRLYLFDRSDEEILQEHQDTFSDSRYFYEPTAPISSSGAPLKLAIKLICATLFLYKQRGCVDPFVVRFDVDDAYFKHVLRIVLVDSSE
jgi:hypothetical protein